MPVPKGPLTLKVQGTYCIVFYSQVHFCKPCKLTKEETRKIVLQWVGLGVVRGLYRVPKSCFDDHRIWWEYCFYYEVQSLLGFIGVAVCTSTINLSTSDSVTPFSRSKLVFFCSCLLHFYLLQALFNKLLLENELDQLYICSVLSYFRYHKQMWIDGVRVSLGSS